MWMESLFWHEKFLAGGSAISVLVEWVVKIDLLANPLANELTYQPSPTHWPRTPTSWPTPYNWRVGYNSFNPWPPGRNREKSLGHVTLRP